MTIVLDSNGLTMLASNRARLEELRRRGEWPAVLPSVVLVEALTGDPRRDYHENRVLRTCDIRPVGELLARGAGSLRSRTGLRRVRTSEWYRSRSKGVDYRSEVRAMERRRRVVSRARVECVRDSR